MIRAIVALVVFTAVYAYAADDGCISCHIDLCEKYEEQYSCVTCHGGVPGTNRKELAHYRFTPGKYADFINESPQVKKGAEIINSASCRRCHTINHTGNRLASDLDITVKRLTAQQIDDNISTPNDQMPRFNFTPEAGAAVVTALLHYSSQTNDNGNIIEIVHFGGGTSTQKYDEKCGGCHRMLSGGGALGRHTLAPFLSGLYTEFYPPLKGRIWDEKLLSQWIDNPRSINPSAVMPVPDITAEEKTEILTIFRGGSK